MNIKEAKEEILHTIQIYTRKDAHGQYLMPSVRQRPVLLIDHPESARLPSWNRFPANVESVLPPIPSRTTPARVP